MDISNYNTYITEMQKSVEDKLFFLKLLPGIDMLVDYGCADGTLLKTVREIRPDLKLHGIDLNPAMISFAKQNIPEATFSVNMFPVMEELDVSRAAINLSSVIHEVYSYSREEDIRLFWEYLNRCGCRYIVIRDMMCDVVGEPADPEDVRKVRSVEKYREQLADFEAIYGSVDGERELIHFLLKYRYRMNWMREVRENYLPVTTDELLSNIDLSKYRVIHRENFILPFLKQTVKETFDIDMKHSTHLKLILEKVESEI